VVMIFLVVIVYSKHLHIFVSEPNVLFSRRPIALGPLATTPNMDPEELSEDDVFGAGEITHFSWKQLLDLLSCTECGRCQDQCPAWNTGKPLSPKLVIMDLRDNLFGRAGTLLGGSGGNGSGADVAGSGDEGNAPARLGRGGRARAAGVLHRRSRPPARERAPLPDAVPAERRDPRQRGHPQGHRLVPALLQHHLEGVPGPGRQLRGDPPLAAAGQAGGRGTDHTGPALREHRHLPRPVLP